MKLDHDLQRAGARYANAKADETYFYMILAAGLVVGIGVMGFRLVNSVSHIFGM